jgi:hypothetical protein
MTTKKYELVAGRKQYTPDGHPLYQIRALRDFADVEAGDLGGEIESEMCLSHGGDCWVYNYAVVYGGSRLEENATAHDHSCVRGNSVLCGNATVSGSVTISGESRIGGDYWMHGGSVIVEATFRDGKGWICVRGDEPVEPDDYAEERRRRI